MAPELMALNADQPEKLQGYFGQYVDIFNSGIILFNMIFQQNPFLNAVATDQFYKYIILEQSVNFWKTH